MNLDFRCSYKSENNGEKLSPRSLVMKLFEATSWWTCERYERVPVHFFSLPLIFTLHWWPLAFLILSPPLQNFHAVLPTKKCMFCFLSLAINPCRPFSRWALLACRLLSLFLCLSSCSIFQICEHDNLSKLNTSDNTDRETISAFRFRLYWLFCCLCFTRRWWLCDFPPK